MYVCDVEKSKINIKKRTIDVDDCYFNSSLSDKVAISGCDPQCITIDIFSVQRPVNVYLPRASDVELVAQIARGDVVLNVAVVGGAFRTVKVEVLREVYVIHRQLGYNSAQLTVFAG